MDSRTIGRVALISIHPEYAEAILSGEKRVEFRKKPIAQDVTHVVLYATKPVGAVVGVFSVEGQQTGSPDRLWDQFSDVAGIDKTRFEAYFSSHHVGAGIRIGNVYRTLRQLRLDEALGIERAPQSLQYLDRGRALSLFRRIESDAGLPLGDLIRERSGLGQLEIDSIAD